MKKIISLILTLIPLLAVAQLRTITYPTSVGNVDIALVGHGSVMIGFNGKTIQVDPYSKVVDYATLPKADLVLITHEHGDHLDKEALEKTLKTDTEIISTQTVAGLYDKVSKVMKNGDETHWNGIGIEAVPAYNIVHVKENGEAYHPEGVGNGYVLSFDDFRVYIAGDTEPIPEMYKLQGVNVAFLPKNLPYTMSDEEFVDAARMVKPEVLFPYHYSQIDKKALQEQLEDIKIR